MVERDSTTIRVYEDDRKRISAYGLFGESFADVIKRILDEYEEYKKRESEKINPCEAVSALAVA